MKQATKRIAILFIANLVAVILLYTLFKIGLFYIIGWSEQQQTDYLVGYYPALHAADPYSIPFYFNPPWLIWLLRPLALLAPADSFCLWLAIVFLLVMRCTYALGGGALAAVLTMTSPGFIESVINGQVDVLVLIGLLVGSWLLILIKPQVAGAAVVYDVIRERRVDWPSLALIGLSFLAHGFWPASISGAGLITAASLSPWPYGIPGGVALFALALRRRDRYLAALSSFFFAPYISGNSLLVYIAILTTRYGRVVAVTSWLALWLLTWWRFS